MNGDPIDRAFHSSDPDVRRRAVYQMSLRPAGTPLEQILEALSDSDWRVRREAISLAAQTHEKHSLVDALLARVVDTDNIGLRNAAIEVLGMVGQEQRRRAGLFESGQVPEVAARSVGIDGVAAAHPLVHAASQVPAPLVTT